LFVCLLVGWLVGAVGVEMGVDVDR